MIIPAAEGNGPIDRVPTQAKLIALFGLSVTLFVLNSATALALCAGVIGAVTIVWCRPALVQWLKAWPLLLTIAVVGIWTVFARGPEAALITVLRLGTLSLFATIITITTTIGQFIDIITRLVTPLEKLGIANARDIGLAIGLVIRFVPEVQARYRSVVDAHRARGLKLRPATIIVPTIIGTMLSADEIANAIDARTLRGRPEKPN